MTDMYMQRYVEIQAILDQAHGGNEGDGAAQGIVEDVYLLMLQRDEARAEVAELRRRLLLDPRVPADELISPAAMAQARAEQEAIS